MERACARLVAQPQNLIPFMYIGSFFWFSLWPIIICFRVSDGVVEAAPMVVPWMDNWMDEWKDERTKASMIQ